MAGIRTSAITHDVSLRSSDRRNSSADAKARTVYPSELKRLPVPTRTDASSSMIAIAGRLDTRIDPSKSEQRVFLHRHDMAECAGRLDRKIIPRFTLRYSSAR